MPRGIPNAPLAGSSEHTQRLLASIRELEERLAVERRKDRARRLLLVFCQKHGLTSVDLKAAAKAMGDRKVGDAPVVSKKMPLRLDKLKPAKGKIGKAIRAARVKASLSDRDIATRIHASVTTVAKWQQVGQEVPVKFHQPLTELLKLPKGTFPAANGAAPP